MPAIDDALEILRATRDGEDLAPEHLKLVEIAVNGWLSEAGEIAFAELLANVRGGYVRPWLHGVEHLAAYLSLDRRRMFCVFRGPDAESVRIANRKGGAPFDRAWSATRHEP